MAPHRTAFTLAVTLTMTSHFDAIAVVHACVPANPCIICGKMSPSRGLHEPGESVRNKSAPPSGWRAFGKISAAWDVRLSASAVLGARA